MIFLGLGICMGQGYYYPENDSHTRIQDLKKGDVHLVLPSNWIDRKNSKMHKQQALGLIFKSKNNGSCILSTHIIFAIKTQPLLVAKTKVGSMNLLSDCITKSRQQCSLIPFKQATLLPYCHNKPRIIYGLQS